MPEVVPVVGLLLVVMVVVLWVLEAVIPVVLLLQHPFKRLSNSVMKIVMTVAETPEYIYQICHQISLLMNSGNSSEALEQLPESSKKEATRISGLGI